MRSGGQTATKATDALIENYIGENMHEFTIATVYEGPIRCWRMSERPMR